MASYSPVTPITRNSETGFSVNSTIEDTLRQNFKMLLLTIPGERIMQPDFGVGISRFLFERFDASVFSQIESRIKTQTSEYIPAIRISDITFDSSSTDKNQLGLTISYSIRGIGIRDSISI